MTTNQDGIIVNLRSLTIYQNMHSAYPIYEKITKDTARFKNKINISSGQ